MFLLQSSVTGGRSETEMQYSVNLIPTPYFYPIGSTPATCLTEQLPPGKRATCLLLGTGDPRDILFTIFNEEDNGTPITFNALSQVFRGSTISLVATSNLPF